MAKIKSITIVISPELNGLAQSQSLKVETENDENPRGVEVLKILAQAMDMILEQIV